MCEFVGQVRKFFYPESIVIIGVSNRQGNQGQDVLRNLIEYGYAGQVYLVGRSGGSVLGHAILTSIDDLPHGIDLAVIVAGAKSVPATLEALGRKGVHHACIESSGFEEVSGGTALQAEVVETAARWGICFTGPNGLGVVNLKQGVCAPFSRFTREWYREGDISIISQSGGMVHHMGNRLTAAGLGIAKAVSMGNKVNLNEADFLEYLVNDPETRVIWLYLEGISSGRRLLEIASISSKPILLLKAGRSQASSQILKSHAASLSSDDQVVSAAAHQANILRIDDFDQMVNVSKAFCMPPVKGNRLLVFARSGGTAVMAVDSAERFGFRLDGIPPWFADEIRRFNMVDVIEPTNPVDLGANYAEDTWLQLAETAAEKLKPDAIILSYMYTPIWSCEYAAGLAEKIARLGQRLEIPLALVIDGKVEDVDVLERNLGFPVFQEIEHAMQGLAVARDWYLGRGRQAAIHDSQDMNVPGSKLRLDASPSLPEALALVERFGIPAAPWAVAAHEHAAAGLAEGLGYPLALKVVSNRFSHKTDVGGVALNIANPEMLLRELNAMRNRMAATGSQGHDQQFLLQKMAYGGREMMLGARRDPTFGPVVVLGMGGVYVEVFKDTSLRLAPLTRTDAAEMIHELRAFSLLQGVRGEAPADLEALAEALLTVSNLMLVHPEISELDINPLLVTQRGALALDARIIVNGYEAETAGEK